MGRNRNYYPMTEAVAARFYKMKPRCWNCKRIIKVGEWVLSVLKGCSRTAYGTRFTKLYCDSCAVKLGVWKKRRKNPLHAQAILWGVTIEDIL